MLTVTFGLAALAAMVGFCIIPNNIVKYAGVKPVERNPDMQDLAFCVIYLCIVAMVICAGLGC